LRKLYEARDMLEKCLAASKYRFKHLLSRDGDGRYKYLVDDRVYIDVAVKLPVVKTKRYSIERRVKRGETTLTLCITRWEGAEPIGKILVDLSNDIKGRFKTREELVYLIDNSEAISRAEKLKCGQLKGYGFTKPQKRYPRYGLKNKDSLAKELICKNEKIHEIHAATTLEFNSEVSRVVSGSSVEEVRGVIRMLEKNLTVYLKALDILGM